MPDRRTFSTLAALGCIALAAGLPALHQLAVVGLAASGQDQSPAFTAQTELVLVNVSVRDRHGRHITGLSGDHFRVLENGQPQRVAQFLADDAPATVGLLLDTSGSMAVAKEGLAAAAAAFARSSNPRDEMFALAFNESISPVLPASEPFTSDPERFTSALQSAHLVHGRTALLDGISSGIRYASRGNHQRRVLIVASDGGDNASVLDDRQLLNEVRSANVVIYTVAFVDPFSQDGNIRRLRELSRETGGQTFTVTSSRPLASILEEIAEDVRSAYVLAYEPRPGSPELRSVRVTFHSRDHGRVTVRSRSSYLARSRP